MAYQQSETWNDVLNDHTGKPTQIVEPDIGSRVLAFYEELPFNYRESAENSAEAIRSQNAAAHYPVLPPLLSNETRVLDVGCGAGWLSNGIAFHYGSRVTGIDFNPVAVERAQQVAATLDLDNVGFRTADLFEYGTEVPYDLVVSIGVLHHTADCHAAVRKACSALVRPGGHVMIGLYHQYGRRPFLDLFAQMKSEGAPEQEMLERFRGLHSGLSDEVHLVSWFRDQVCHPHETQHTLEEMIPILHECDMELISTSINRFAEIGTLEELFEQERRYEVTAVERLKEGKYFPGFFVFLARKAA